MDHTQLRSAAAEYPYLRGLISVPAGALFIVAALGNTEWGPFATTGCSSLALLVDRCRLLRRSTASTTSTTGA